MALASTRNVLECQAVAEVFESIPEALRPSDPAWLVVQARALCFARRPEALEAVASRALARWGEAARGVRAYLAWARVQNGARPQEALELADAVIADGGDSFEIGLAWRVRAEALSWLERDGWRTAFARARGLLTGRSLGTGLIAEGYHLDRHGETAAARRVWSEAAAVLSDPYYAAWVQYNLGMSFLKDASPEAEAHFLRMERLTRRGVGAGFSARSWCGIGASRRVLGEWVRAESAYRTALRSAHEAEDQLEAWRGLGHTLRLAGRPVQALEALHGALALDLAWVEIGRSWVMTDVAAARLAMGDAAGAREALEQAEPADADDRDRERIVRAELHRRAGRLNAVLEQIAEVNFSALCAREERSCFPEVFALFAAMGARTPALLERSGQTVVEVQAMGVLRVRVNGRDVPISPTSITGELLVVLLQSGGEATTEGLMDALYVHQGDARRSRQALSKQVRFLREALGWAGSLRSLGGAYRLDPDATWRYDVRDAQGSGAPIAHFLEGNYRPWARETARQLETEERALN